MKRLIYTSLFCALSALLFSKEPFVEKKSYEKTFSVNSDVVSKVVNSFGNVSYKIGKNNEVVYKVEVIVDGRDEEKVRRKLNSINIIFSKEGNIVSGKTQYEDIKVKNVNMSINYVVYIPASASIDLLINYTDVHLPTLKNKIKISSNYGDIYANEQTHDFTFSGNYCDLYINDVSSLDFVGNYCDIKLNNVQNFNLSGSYCDIKIVNSEKLDLGGANNEIKVVNVQDLKVSGAYTDLVVDVLKKSAIVKGAYADFTIKKMADQVSTIEASGAYANFYIATNYNSQIIVKGDKVDLTYDRYKFEVTRLKNDNDYVTFEAKTGKNPTTKINIVGAKADVILK